VSRSPTIAFLVDYVFSSYQAGLLAAIEEATRERGFSLLTVVGGSLDAPLRSEATQNHIYELLDARTIDGLIIVAGCLSNNSGPVALAQYCLHHFKRLPMCSIGATLPGIPSLVISNRQGTQAGVEHLIVEHGARRIGFIGGPTESPEAAERYEGYLAALGKHEIRLDPRLVTRGAFTVHSGLGAARELFSRSLELDAVVAANDYMAAAALDIAREHGRNVPRNLRIVGFDDAPFAPFTTPSLTTVRQPLERLGRMAVDAIVSALEGAPLIDRVQVDVELVRRQSCGCGLGEPRRTHSIPPSLEPFDGSTSLLRHRAALVERLHTALRVPALELEGWAERVIDGLIAELSGRKGRFLEELDALLAASAARREFLEEFVKLVGVLRDALYELRPAPTLALELEQLWHEAQIALGNAATNAHGRTKVDLEMMLSRLRVGFERIATALQLPALSRAVTDTLPSVNIRRAAISLAAHALEPNGVSAPPSVGSHSSRPGNGRISTLVPLLAVSPERTFDGPREFAAQELAPPGFFPKTRHSHVVLPLTFEDDWLGVLVVEHAAHEAVYVLLRDEISSALKGTSLQRLALRETALRERAEGGQRDHELKLARRLQGELLPLETQIPGLTVAARVVPGAETGGDFHDVIARPDGGWLAMGGTSTQGLPAALMSLCIQAMVSASVRSNAEAGPRELIIALNEALIEQLQRQAREQPASVSLVRYARDGRIRVCGAKEQPLVHRRRTGECSPVLEGGVTLGTLADVSELALEADLMLEDGDLLVLYTDGLIGALNDHGEPFGLERLRHAIRANAGRGVDQISQALVDSVGEWQSSPQDDVSVLVARYTAPERQTSSVAPPAA
jgi:DNA-binding LacI/PurR family transcriptional regulator/serine phosphatase RsbU (regulator of sigma subunit)